MELSQSSRSVFILGSPRSGTSVLAWAIAQHADMCTGPEADFPYYLLRASSDLEQAWELAHRRADGWLAVNHVEKEEYLASLGFGIDQLFLSRSGGRRWVEQSPGNTLVAPKLATMFPNTQFLHIIRDGRAVVNSLINSGFHSRAAQDFRSACETWAHFVRKGLETNVLMPGRLLEIRHERLSEDPETVMREVQEFLQLEPSGAPARFLRTNRINSSYGNTFPEDIRRPKPDSVLPKAPWRQWTRKQKALFLEIAHNTMIELGYDPSLD